MTDVVKRLRYIQEGGQCDCHICETAGNGADEIEALRSRLDKAQSEIDRLQTIVAYLMDIVEPPTLKG